MWRFLGASSACLVLKRSHCYQRGDDEYAATRMSPKSRTKTIHFIRHAEGHHNVAGRKDPMFGYLREDLEDPSLTDNGVQQCKDLAAKSANVLSGAQLVVVSPMNRTMETATYCLPQLVGTIPWIAVENVREQTGLHPCDRRKTIGVHKDNFLHIDFTGIKSDKDPLYFKYRFREPNVDIALRARHFMRWLKERPESEIVVVSHHHYLQVLFHDVIKTAEPDKDDVDFKNCELRTFVVKFED